VGGRGTWNLPRVCAVAVVAGLHAALVCVLVMTHRSRPPASLAGEVTATLVLFPELRRALPRRASPLPPRVTREAAPAAPAAITLPPTPRVPETAAGTVDWDSEARRAAAAAVEKPRYRDFGMPRAPSWLAPGHASSHHEAGEQYRSETGEWIVWVSDRCFISVEPRPLGVPDVFARAQVPMVACR
jgi:hypothetical protein